MNWLARHWQVSVVLVALLVVGVAFAVASDIGALPASEQSDATTTAIVGAVIGALAAIVVFGGSSLAASEDADTQPGEAGDEREARAPGRDRRRSRTRWCDQG